MSFKKLSVIALLLALLLVGFGSPASAQTAPTAYGFIKPTAPCVITGFGFGSNWLTVCSDNISTKHNAVDVDSQTVAKATKTHQQVWAAADGVVRFAGSFGSGWANVVILEHNVPGIGLVTTLYGHIEIDPNITVGKVVTAGTNLGYISPNVSSGPHLHFGVRARAYDSLSILGRLYSCANTAHTPKFPEYWKDPLQFVADHPLSLAAPNPIEVERAGWTVVGGGRRSRAAWTALSQRGSLWVLHNGYNSGDAQMYLGAINPSTGDSGFWEVLPGQTLSSPSMAGEVNGTNRYYTHLGLDGNVYWMTEDLLANTRTSWSWMNGARSSDPCSITAFQGKLFQIHRGGSDGVSMLVNGWSSSAGWWPSWWTLEGRTAYRPGIAPFIFDIYAIHRGETGQIYLKDLTVNSAWYGLPGTRTPVTPSMTEFNGRLYIIHETDDNHIKVAAYRQDGSLSGWQDIGGTTLLQPGLVQHAGRLYATRVSPSGYMYIRDITDIVPL